MLYGVAGEGDGNRMPFNRADYFIGNSETPTSCAENTGVLYRATVDHSSGGPYTSLPILDCVADMKVVVGWDTSDTALEGARIYSSLPKVAGGTPDYFVSGDSSTVTSEHIASVTSYFSSAKDVRERLKLIKIYLLVQEGKRDSNYQSPATIVVGGNSSEAGSLPTTSNTYTFTTAQRQFHWKVYRVIVRPRNLVSNQK